MILDVDLNGSAIMPGLLFSCLKIEISPRKHGAETHLKGGAAIGNINKN